MKKIASLTAAALLAAGLGAGAAQAEPGGCLKYGAAGAVGGHLVHHGVVGAVGGCATGMWRRHEYRKHEKELARQERLQQQDQRREQYDHVGGPPDGGPGGGSYDRPDGATYAR